jgi:hypothetical protein
LSSTRRLAAAAAAITHRLLEEAEKKFYLMYDSLKQEHNFLLLMCAMGKIEPALGIHTF